MNRLREAMSARGEIMVIEQLPSVNEVLRAGYYRYLRPVAWFADLAYNCGFKMGHREIKSINADGETIRFFFLQL